MSKINFGRVLLGGLVAGVVLNFFEFLLNGVVLRSQMEADFKRMNLTPPGTGFVAYAVVTTLLFGVVAVLLYAIFRTRLGPGPRTAILTAIILWFCIYAYAGVINMMLINVPANVILFIMGWGVIEYSVGLLAGAALYKED
jgi:hypothetical protein